MSLGLRRLPHRGPRSEGRRQAVAADLRPIAGRLRAGAVLMDEVAALFAGAGCRGGVVFLEGVVCDPFRYVLPALAIDDDHAAFYSATHAPEGPVRIGASTASVGWRDGAPFLHCHGRWQLEGGEAMGHVLPFDCRLAADAEVTGLGSASAWFEGIHDAETNFTLFSAVGGGAPAPAQGLLLRLRPEEDVVTAIAQTAAAHGLVDAQVQGLGSICGVRFADGTGVDCVATEVRIDSGLIRDGRAEIDISVVDTDGRISSGRLVPGRNPVGVTFEIVVAPLT